MSTSCFSSVTSGPLPGVTMVPEVLNPISTVSSIFTLNAKGWISPTKGTFTFIQAIADRLETTTNVALTTGPLDTSYQFIFQKIGCPNQNPIISYGDRVQLVTYNLRIANCGNGTCSTVDPNTYGGCDTNSWQTFTVESASGKSGPVCFGDDIFIRQTIGNKCNLSAAGGTAVFCIDGTTNPNSVLTIFPVGGSLYVDPSQYVAQYSQTQQQNLCAANPLDPSCITGDVGSWFSSFTSFFSKIGTILLIIGIIFILSIMGLVFYYIRSGLSVFGTSSSSSSTTIVKAAD